MEFIWKKEPASFEVKGNSIMMVAQKGTNLFNSPGGTYQCADFPYYCTEFEGDFVVRCKITPEMKALYDQGGIVIWENEKLWIKFAYENSDIGYPAMVSVVTREYSDDCNGPRGIDGTLMQVSRKGDGFALHFSEDGKKWLLARICSVAMAKKVYVGISAQCPMGENCRVMFEDLEVLENTYTDIRNLKR